ncbi:MAG: MMPL family transporter [Lachnospiraceae bacterium]|nr:MMPL family transporter [Lachnospiraceae bacterium]
MGKISEKIVKLRIPIFILSLLLLIPALIGYVNTRINYDILTYLPGEIETMQGQDILEEEFGTGAFAMLIVEGMDDKDVAKLKSKVSEVDHVKNVIWYDSIADLSVPMEMLPDDLYEAFNGDGATEMFVIFDETTSADGTMDAVEEIRRITGEQAFLSGMSATVVDTKNLTIKETPIYVGIAVLLAVIVLSLTMDNYLIPLFFLSSIGMAILYNLGTNVFRGEISFLTQALSAVLQLGVTLDYSIFLWHSYREELEKGTEDKKAAMAAAIDATFVSVLGSSITTVAGFVALCFMSFGIGLDIGIVMAKGVVIGVIACITILPSMILIFDKVLEKTNHKPLMREFDKIPDWIVNHHLLLGALFLVLLVPAIYGYRNTSVYYNLGDTLPEYLPSVQAIAKQDAVSDINSTYVLLLDKDLSETDTRKMIRELKEVDGITSVLGTDSIVGPLFPKEMIPEDLLADLESDRHKMMLVSSEYKVATDEVNAQIARVNTIVKSYDQGGMVVGEAPCTKDLITITDKDFKVVSWISIGAVFFIIFFVLRSLSLPVILVSVIEFAIFINMGLTTYTGTTIPFIASVVIGTIQLGSTVDYAILMTTRYCKERKGGCDKAEATRIALKTGMKSVIVSALSFFAATFGVGLISSIDMIGALCNLMARGAIVSMIVVILVLPSMYMCLDGLICRTTLGMPHAAFTRRAHTGLRERFGH